MPVKETICEWDKARAYVESLCFEKIKKIYNSREDIPSFKGVDRRELFLRVQKKYYDLRYVEESKQLFARKLEIRNVRLGLGYEVYAELVDVETGQPLISATLDYINEKLKAMGLAIAKQKR